MYSKIAIKNVKKSFKDYAIYFLTLTLAVCIFYSFNAIGSQKAFLQMDASSQAYVSLLVKAIAGISVFVSIILGSLILYANNFLIKKRKKELGIYMTLGMGKRKISHILVIETLLVGIISLISGLILGIGVSQGLSIFTLKLFDLPYNQYHFAISTGAIGKTVLYFGIMFLLVMLFNVVIIAKYKIIDLLTAGRKNQEMKFKNPVLYFITFILCVMSLGFAYKIILEIGLNITNNRFLVSIGLGILGTVLFFFSLSGFMLYIIKKNKKIYLKGLNIFVIKQINSKVNTNFLSMSLICLMLFITIGILSTGISFKTNMDESLEIKTPFDASIYLINKDKSYDIETLLNKSNFKISNQEAYISYNLYETGMKIKDFFENEKSNFSNVNVDFIKTSDYNKILSLKGEKKVDLNPNEVLILSSSSHLIHSVNERLKSSNKIMIEDKAYLIKNHEVILENLQTDVMAINFLTIVIDDEFLSNYNITKSVLNVKYLEGNREEHNKKYYEIQSYISEYGDENWDFFHIDGITKDSVYTEGKGLTTIILFIGIYIGMVFLITSMAVLALQQLSEASDSIERYKALRRIGATREMIEKTIFLQTLLYFSLPVILACLHSVIGINVVDSFISTFQKTDIRSSALTTALIFVVVYGGYFYTTYTGYKNIIRDSL
ncbi:MAG: FtsX-like permease family protein [Clostridiaceae bacterium]|nr:FtsX-like permease family protein [Clostridiaceae bacterium]